MLSPSSSPPLCFSPPSHTLSHLGPVYYRTCGASSVRCSGTIFRAPDHIPTDNPKKILEYSSCFFFCFVTKPLGVLSFLRCTRWIYTTRVLRIQGRNRKPPQHAAEGEEDRPCNRYCEKLLYLFSLSEVSNIHVQNVYPLPREVMDQLVHTYVCITTKTGRGKFATCRRASVQNAFFPKIPLFLSLRSIVLISGSFDF